MSTLISPATTRRSADHVVADRIGTAAALESTVQRSRRLELSAERRRQRLTTAVSAALVGLGSAGTLAFAALMVSFH
jgi:hypothetical protein